MNDPLKSLERLGEEFERVARERRRRWLPRRTALFASVGGLSASAVALAASGALTGEPVKDPPGTPKPQPHVAAGVVRANTVTLTALRVPDPAGGPPWGLRTLRTTREQGCVQVGRVRDGRVGVLGQDGSFGDDGRFHELAPEVQRGRDCALLDGAGKLFIAMSVQGLPASAEGGKCAVDRMPPRFLRTLPKAVRRRHAAIPLCPREDMRILYYGTLGPQAQSVTYKDRGVRKTAATSGPWGAYLVVVRPDRKHRAQGYYVPTASPGSGLVAVTYRDGHTCRIRSPRALGGAKLCPRVGYVVPRSNTPSPRQLAARVSVRFSSKPLVVGGPSGEAQGPKSWRVHVSFTARVAAGPRSFYFVTQKVTPMGSCRFGGMAMAPIARDVRAGERVSRTFYVPEDCRGSIAGEVRFEPASDRGRPLPFESANPFRAPIVGRYRARIPRG